MEEGVGNGKEGEGVPADLRSDQEMIVKWLQRFSSMRDVVGEYLGIGLGKMI